MIFENLNTIILAITALISAMTPITICWLNVQQHNRANQASERSDAIAEHVATVKVDLASVNSGRDVLLQRLDHIEAEINAIRTA